jgi:hypothetical protein
MLSIFIFHFLISIADASFWLLIITGIGITFWLCFKRVMNYLLEEIETEEEEE